MAKIVIEKERIFAENSNRTHGFGTLNLNTFEPFPKNPTISKVFREIGLADELGSGMRNTYKFTKLYSGGTPQFVEGDIFKTIIPLNDTATMKLGPTVSDQVAQSNVEDKILQYCKVARTKKEIAIYNTREATEQAAKIFRLLWACRRPAFQGGGSNAGHGGYDRDSGEWKEYILQELFISV